MDQSHAVNFFVTNPNVVLKKKIKLLHVFHMLSLMIYSYFICKRNQNSELMSQEWKHYLSHRLQRTLIKAHSTYLTLSTYGFASVRKDDLPDCSSEVRWTLSNYNEKCTHLHLICIGNKALWSPRFICQMTRTEKWTEHLLWAGYICKLFFFMNYIICSSLWPYERETIITPLL